MATWKVASARLENDHLSEARPNARGQIAS
jgi:hypothetical protein